MKRAATPAEVNVAFEEARILIGRPMSYEEIQALDADLARVIERDEVEHIPALHLSERLRALGQSGSLKVMPDDVVLFSLAAGALAGQYYLIKELERKLEAQRHFSHGIKIL